MLSNKDTYSVINKDPTNKMTNKLKELLTKWKKSNYISKATYKSVCYSDGVLPRVHNVPNTQAELSV